jgi:hypothetical protein
MILTASTSEYLTCVRLVVARNNLRSNDYVVLKAAVPLPSLVGATAVMKPYMAPGLIAETRTMVLSPSQASRAFCTSRWKQHGRQGS